MFSLPHKRALLSGVPSWVLGTAVGNPATVDINFQTGQSYGASISQLTTVRSTVSHTFDYAFDANGILQSFLANTPRITTKGLLVETTKGNTVQNCRDLTQTGSTHPWVVGATMSAPALNQTGIDGLANSASLITSNGVTSTATISQVTSAASSTRWQTCYVKRVSGSGTLEMSMDSADTAAASLALATWTVVPVTNAWTRVEIPTQTITNPTFALRIGTSGDSFAIDFCQNENSAVFASSPILTSATVTTRSVDSISLSSPLAINPQGISLFAQGTPLGDAGGSSVLFGLSNGDGTANFRHLVFRGAPGRGSYITTDSGVTQATISSAAAWANNVSGKVAGSSSANSFDQAFNGVSGTPDPSGTMPPGINTFRFGAGEGSALCFNGYVERVAFWNSKLTPAQLQAITL